MTTGRALRRLAVGLGAVAVALLLAAAGTWLVYGESVTVLQGLVTATAEAPPDGVRRIDLTVDGAEAVVHADVYDPEDGARAVLLLVPGLTSAGREDRRVVGVAGVLAQAGFRVVVPDLPGAIGLSSGWQDVAVLGVLMRHLVEARAQEDLPLGVVAISYGVGPALAAAAAPERAPAVDLVLGLGGYYDGRNVVTYVTTGSYVDPRDGLRRAGSPDPRARWMLLQATADHVADLADRARLQDFARYGVAGSPPDDATLDAAAKSVGADAAALLALVRNRDPARVDALLDAAPAGARDALVALSPAALDLTPLAGRILLVHGESDAVIPFSESLRLAAVVPGTQVVLIPGFSHVDPGAASLAGQWAMVRAVRRLLALRD